MNEELKLKIPIRTIRNMDECNLAEGNRSIIHLFLRAKKPFTRLLLALVNGPISKTFTEKGM